MDVRNNFFLGFSSTDCRWRCSNKMFKITSILTYEVRRGSCKNWCQREILVEIDVILCTKSTIWTMLVYAWKFIVCLLPHLIYVQGVRSHRLLVNPTSSMAKKSIKPAQSFSAIKSAVRRRHVVDKSVAHLDDSSNNNIIIPLWFLCLSVECLFIIYLVFIFSLWT